MSVILETSLGDIVIDLLVDTSPKACENFLKLCKVKYYNYSPVYNVQKNFSFQTGDPIGPDSKDSDGGSSIWGLLNGPSQRTFPIELPPKMKHVERGTVSMATVPSTKNPDERLAGSQFIITLGDNLDYLDGKAAIFGKVVEGFDVLENINDAFIDDKGRPLKDIRIRHTVILDDPFDDPPDLVVPPKSPLPSKAQLATVMIADDEELDENIDEEAVEKLRREREARAQALTLEMVGDLPFAEVKPPENVLFVCKLNPVTQDEDLHLIFSRFGPILSCEVIRDKRTGDSLQYAFIEFENQKDCEQAYVKMQGVLIDDHRIHVDFSQSVSKLSDSWRNATNSKRAGQRGGFGGISNLEKRRQYRASEAPRRDGYGMVFDKEDMRRKGDPESYRRSRSRSPPRRPRNRSRSPPRRHYDDDDRQYRPRKDSARYSDEGGRRRQ
ncbi:peptidyl-prolyl cis-trans isomerase-like 4 [Emergomyces africanus]|uniref:Peptidyl-prolyl cis-trans isomerase n=1 Tax=Emergomyces africanus TaxID=1955775 RepID=A0A1B7NW55_9EURO|nr:peptidyl-prolyl cis-trans isomerase-like 4 [Emergomyces africanus]